MGWYVHLHIAFEVDNARRLADVARTCPPRADDDPPEADQFLDAIGGGGFVARGRKGALCTWGVVANYTSGQTFIDALSDLWPKLYEEPPGDELAAVSGRIVVFEEQEQSGAACAYQIEWTRNGIVVTRFDELPISWGQA